MVLGLVGAAGAQTRPGENAGVAVYVGEEVLKDYRPRPELVTKQTKVDKPRFPAIDVHCHWSLKEDPEEMLKAMDELGLKVAVNLSGGHGEELDRMLEKFAARAPERLKVLCTPDLKGIDGAEWGKEVAAFLEQAKGKGVAGVKVYKNLGLTLKDGGGKRVAVDDARLEALWEACGRLKLPVLIHSGDPMAFFRPVDRYNERWMQLKRHPGWSFFGEGFPTYEQVMAEHVRVIEKHPKTVFISAHLANSGEDLGQLSGWLEKCPNLYVDLSGRVAELGRQPYAARKFLIRFQDRVLFGTDRYPGRKDQPRERVYYRFLETDDEYFDYHEHAFPPEGEWKIYGVFLPEEVLKKIYAGNAERALRGEGPVTRPAGG